MKLIIAIIKPFKLEVKAALSEIGVEGMTVTEVKASVGNAAIPRFTAAASTPSTSTQGEIEIVVPDDVTGKVIDVISRGEDRQNRRWKIFVVPVEEAVRIRTDEHGDAAV